MIESARFRILGEANPRVEHRHDDRWVRMQQTIPVLTDRSPRSYRSTWKCPSYNEKVLHEWRASVPVEV